MESIGKMKISCTAGFRVMSDEEIEKLNASEKPQLCLKDDEKHIIVTLGCKEVNGFASMILNEKDLAKQTEKELRKPFEAFGYRFDSFVSQNVAGQKAEGYLYDYDVQDTEMSGKTLCLKRDRIFYYIYAYFRRAGKEESLKAFDGLLETAVWD